MPKLAIYVPKKRMREIERWRKSINFSQVFMKALLTEIRNRSRAIDAAQGKVSAAAAYYRQKLDDAAGPLHDVGYSLGSEHVLACRLEPETIRELLELVDREAFGSQHIERVERALGADRRKIDAWAARNGCDNQKQPAWRSSVYRGYVAGVADAWKKVCEHLASEQRRTP